METNILMLLIISIFLIISILVTIAFWCALILNRRIDQARGVEDPETGSLL